MRDVKYSLDWLLKTKADLMKMLDSSRQTLKQAKEDTEIWEMMVNDVDAEIAEVQEEEHQKKRLAGRLKPLILIILAAVILTMVVGCGTLEGLRSDIHNLTAPSRLESDK